MTRCWVMAI